MEISVGQPLIEGRYVVFVQCASHQISEWCEPAIATWQGGRWHFSEPVYGWIGPLPPTRCKPLLDALGPIFQDDGEDHTAREYDL